MDGIPVELHDPEFELLGHWFKLQFLIKGKELSSVRVIRVRVSRVNLTVECDEIQVKWDLVRVGGDVQTTGNKLFHMLFNL